MSDRTVIVTVPPADREKDPDDPLLDLTHRMACEAAQLAQVSKFYQMTARQPDLTGWRAWMSDETRAAVEYLEGEGFRFVHQDEVAHA